MRFLPMGRFVVILSFFLAFTPVSATAEKDSPGSQDHPLITRLPGFYISGYQENEFDTFDFKTDAGKTTVDGRKYVIDYRINKGKTPPGKIQILKNYLNALTGIGAEVKLKSSYYYVFAITKDDMETWVRVSPEDSDGKRYILTIVERAAMVQEVTADADAMAKGLMQTGHMAVYGIYFDVDKAVVKKESDPALKEIATLLNKEPSLKLYVVGHTDTQGELDYNMKLSLQRAVAVVEALTQRFGIDANRLFPKGLGPLSPVESNRSPKGRAKNRRVELVEI